MESEQGQNYWFVICTLRVWLDLIVIFDSNFKCPFCFRSELYTLLLEDILVLLQKQDERLILKCHSKNLAGTADTKHIFSPIIKLSTVLVRSVATGQLTPRLTAYCIITKLVYGFMHVRQNTDLTSVQCLSLQTTSPSSSFPCQTTVHRSMSWWHPQSQIREREAKNFSIELFLSFHCLESRTNVFSFFSFHKVAASNCPQSRCHESQTAQHHTVTSDGVCWYIFPLVSHQMMLCLSLLLI